jgi:membrane-bound lytic murein transglycosylase D
MREDVKARLTQQEKILSDVMDDTEGRVDKEFHASPQIRSRVKFWIEIYSRFNTSYRIVHDRSNPAIIYGYIDFSPIYKTYGNERLAEAKARQIEKKIVKELKARIAEAAGVSNTSLMTAEEKEDFRKALADFGATTTEQMLALSGHVRTQTGQRDKFLKALQRSRDLLPQIEEVFKKRGLPVALARLPFVESSFNQRALSKTGAMGIWQFMPETARLFEPHGTYAQWSRPLPQSAHAAKLLSGFRNALPNWPIAVTAYNSGAGRLARIVRDYNVQTIDQLVDLPSSKETLGFAGKNFYCEFLAANLVEAYKEKLFPPSHLHPARDSISRRVQSVNAAVAKLVPYKKTPVEVKN